MPNCYYEPTGRLRIYREQVGGQTYNDTLEMLYVDVSGCPFWAPIPVVLADKEETVT